MNRVSPTFLLHATLLEVREHVQKEKAMGSICLVASYMPSWRQGVERGFADLMRIQLRVLLRRWPAGTGDAVYPVPANFWKSRSGARAAFHNHSGKPKWEGRYGKRRRALLDWLIEQTRPHGDTP